MNDLEQTYRQRYELALAPMATAIELQLRDYMSTEPHIDRVMARAKSIERFL